MLFRRNNSRALELLKQPFVLITLFVIVVLAIILIIASVNNVSNVDDRYYSEVDPASGETVYFGPSTGGESNEFQMIGFEEGLIANGVTSEQFFVFKDAIANYAKENNLSLTRVSYVKESFSLVKSYVFDYSIALNIEEIVLKVRIDSSKGWKNILGMTVTFWNEDGEEVYRNEITDENICNYLTWCENLEDDVDFSN